MRPWYFPWKRRPKLSPGELGEIYSHRAKLVDQRARAARHRRTVRDIDVDLKPATERALRADLGLI